MTMIARERDVGNVTINVVGGAQWRNHQIFVRKDMSNEVRGKAPRTKTERIVNVITI